MSSWWNDLDTLQAYNSRLLWIIGALGICTSVAVIVSLVWGDRIGDLEDTEKLSMRDRIAANEASTAKANAEAELAKADAAKARLELAKIDPINLPIKSLTADVYLLIPESSFVGTPLADPKMMPKEIATFCICKSEDALNPRADALLFLNCEKLECGEALLPTSPTVMDAEHPGLKARSLSMSFSWPGTGFTDAHFSSHPELRPWIDKENVSTAELNKIQYAGVIVMGFLPAGAQIVGGSCELRANGSIRLPIVIPQTTSDSRIVFERASK